MSKASGEKRLKLEACGCTVCCLLCMGSALCACYLSYLSRGRHSFAQRLVAESQGNIVFLWLQPRFAPTTYDADAHTHFRSSRFRMTSTRRNAATHVHASSATEVPSPDMSRFCAEMNDHPVSISSQSTAFLVRTFSPTAAMSKRIAKWFSELARLRCVDMYISIDLTQPGNERKVQRLIDRVMAKGFNVNGNVHTYSEQDAVSAYPCLFGRPKISWQFHVQPILLWWKAISHQHMYENLWVSEDDVDLSGDMSRLLSKYSQRADLIGGTRSGLLKKKPKGWKPGLATKEFLRRAHSERYCVREHLERLSANLLGKLEQWSVANACDMSESMVGVVCLRENLTCIPFQKTDLGKPYTWHKAIHDETTWNKQVAADVAAGLARLYHPLKF